MTRALTFTKASIKRAVAAALEAGLCVKGIAPDGTVIVDNGAGAPSLSPGTLQDDPYVAAIERGSNAKAPRKRYARS